MYEMRLPRSAVSSILPAAMSKRVPRLSLTASPKPDTILILSKDVFYPKLYRLIISSLTNPKSIRSSVRPNNRD